MLQHAGLHLFTRLAILGILRTLHGIGTPCGALWTYGIGMAGLLLGIYLYFRNTAESSASGSTRLRSISGDERGCFAGAGKMFHDEARNHIFVISSKGEAGPHCHFEQRRSRSREICCATGRNGPRRSRHEKRKRVDGLCRGPGGGLARFRPFSERP